MGKHLKSDPLMEQTVSKVENLKSWQDDYLTCLHTNSPPPEKDPKCCYNSLLIVWLSGPMHQSVFVCQSEVRKELFMSRQLDGTNKEQQTEQHCWVLLDKQH